ncbi:MAG: anthranilate synthase component I family protein [Bacteroidota bacterium]
MNKYNSKTFELPNVDSFVRKALHWADSFSDFHYFNHCDYEGYLFGTFPKMLSIGSNRKIVYNHNCFPNLESFKQENPHQWLIGHLAYDLKNEIEELESNNEEIIPFSSLAFYIPEHLFFFDEDRVEIHSHQDPTLVFRHINEVNTHNNLTQGDALKPIPDVSEKDYLANIKNIGQQIEEGDFYEINYCMSWTERNISINPISTFLKLNDISPMPFSVLQKNSNHYAICASPERFLKKEGQKLISQPIKGTIKKANDPNENFKQKLKLAGSEKEQAENLMIVDLVRNDLARSSNSGSVKVEELFGIYEFKTINQMISSVSSELKENISAVEALKRAFPMGSMTGAPKIEVMKNIEKYESFKRGLFSGSIGFFKPDGDFDFNVVIRTIFYDKKSKLVNFKVGSAITYDSVPEKEYEECLLKIESLSKALS